MSAVLPSFLPCAKANHMEAVAQVTQKRQTPETGIVLGSGKLEEG